MLASLLQAGYGTADLRADAVAGLTVAVVALPLAMGIAIASGVAPGVGLMTAIVAGAIISALGGSRVQVGGPTAAFAVVVFGIIAEHGLDGLALATAMAGVMLVVAGLLKAGLWMRYVPQPVILGFTAGIAVTIAATQFGALVGIEAEAGSGEVLERLTGYARAAGTADLLSAAVGLGTVGLILGLKQWRPGWPGMLIAILLATAVTAGLGLPVATVGSVFGAQQDPFPVRLIGEVSFARLEALLPAAFTIAFLAGVESLLSAAVADGMTGHRHRPNTELVAQGIANLASGLIGGLPATGAIARTATNIRAGARSPVAGLIHAGALGLLALVAAPVLGQVPLAALAGLLMVVAWNMADVPHLARVLARAPWADRLVTLTTLALTVLYDLTVAVEVGVVLAALLFMHRMSQTVEVAPDTPDESLDRASYPAGVEVFRVDGPVFYAAVDRLERAMDSLPRRPRVLILRLEGAGFIDATGADAISVLARSQASHGGHLILSSARGEVAAVLDRLGVAVGSPRVGDLSEALILAAELTSGTPQSAVPGSGH
jgi:SulP family sulfate permease